MAPSLDAYLYEIEYISLAGFKVFFETVKRIKHSAKKTTEGQAEPE